MTEITLDAIANLAKKRGFVYPASEIYGGLRSSWDYGPLGVELLRNVREAWWESVVRNRDDVVGLDSSIIQAAEVWVASRDADTIVERITFADLSGGSATIDIELVSLSLVSVSPVDLGFGAGFEDIFITLNTTSPSLQSTMTIFDTGVITAQAVTTGEIDGASVKTLVTKEWVNAQGFGGGGGTTVTAQSTNYTAADGDFVLMTTGATDKTVTLPLAEQET